MDLSLYRPNVGVVLFNREGLVWLGRRVGASGPRNWQFPQGGVDDDEAVEAAALRELAEETGVVSVEPLARTPDWIVYDFPPELRDRPGARGWHGQKQIWFAMRFVGDDDEVRLDGHHQIEFDLWRWAHLSEAAELVALFKADAYRQVVAAFSPLAATAR